jgi:hypothetical protein
MNSPVAKLAPGILDAQQGDHRRLDARGDLKTLGQLTLGCACSQGRADPGLAVAIVQAVDFQLGGRKETGQLAPAPREVAQIESDVELAERQLIACRPDGDLAAILRSCL